MCQLASTEILSLVTFEGFTSSGSRERPCGGGGSQPRHGFWRTLLRRWTSRLILPRSRKVDSTSIAIYG